MSGAMPQPKRAPQSLDTIWSFVDEFLVVCPRCAEQAIVKASTDANPPRLTCSSCGLSRDWGVSSRGVLISPSAANWPKGQYALGDVADPYFHLPLWLRVPCGTNTLWAYNKRHLAVLREYVESIDRRKPPRSPVDPRNSLLASSLPKWIKLAKNREAVLRAISSLNEKLSGS